MPTPPPRRLRTAAILAAVLAAAALPARPQAQPAAPRPKPKAAAPAALLSGFAVTPTVFLVREGGAVKQALNVTVKNAGPAADAVLKARVAGRTVELPPVKLAAGDNAFRVTLPELARPETVKFRIDAGGASALADAALGPVRRWTVYLFHHSHTDIGYTDLQTRVLQNHLDYLDSVVDYCRQTANYPDDARFRWNIEAAWALENYVRLRPEAKVRELYDLMKAGRVELSGLRLNLSDTFPAEGLVRAVAEAAALGRAAGVPVRAAMNNDVTGFSWALPQIFRQAGVRAFATGINETRSKAPLRRPNAFWWEGPDGARILHWNGEHYLFANYELLLHEPLAKSAPKVDAYLRALAARGDYPQDVVAFNVSAWTTDNCPPGRGLSDRVRDWNAAFASPRLRLATMSEFFDRMEKDWGRALPVHRLGWPDYWTDGVGSTAYETGLNRLAHEQLLAAEALAASAALLDGGTDARGEMREGQDLSMLYDEHTWGSYDSIDDPDSERARGQWAVKSTFAYRAREIAGTNLARGAARWAKLLASGSAPGFAVLNPLSWTRSGAVVVDLPEALRDPKAKFRVLDRRTGGEARFQAETPASIRVFAKDVPPLGYALFAFDAGREPAAWPAAAAVAGNVIENGFYKVTVDPKTGGVTSLIDKETDRELVDAASPWPLNVYVHELPQGGRKAVDDMTKRAAFDRAVAKKAECSAGPVGPGAATLVVKSVPRQTAGLEARIVLYGDQKRIDFENVVRKVETRTPEAVYFAFPFRVGGAPAAPAGTSAKAAAAGPAVRFEIAGGDMAPEAEQLPGTTRDWHTVQRWVELAGADARVVWSPVEAPLVEFGDINTGKWLKALDVANGRVFSYAMNNYWMTNFQAAQGGRVTFRYSMTSGPGGPSDRVAAARFGAEVHAPLVAAALAPGNKGRLTEASGSLASVDAPNVVVQAVKAAEDGSGAVVVRLREIAGRPAAAKLSSPLLAADGVRAWLSDVLETEGTPVAVAGGAVALALKPFELVTLRFRR